MRYNGGIGICKRRPTKKEEIMNFSEPSAEVKARIAARAAAQDVEVVVKLSKSDFNKGLKIVKNLNGKFNGQTKEWTIELDSLSSTLQHPEWNGIELVSVNGIAIGQEPTAQTNNKVPSTYQILRDMDKEDSIY
jgi:hypothetical protein